MFKKNKKQQTQTRPRARTRLADKTKASSKVFSYYNVRSVSSEEEARAGQSPAQQQRGAKHASSQRYRRFKQIVVLAGFLVLVGALVANSRIYPQTGEVVVKGAPEKQMLLQDKSVYQSATQQILQGKFQYKFKPFINTHDVSQQLLKQYPELSVATISLPLFGNGYTLYIEPSSAALLLTAANNQTYIIDNHGRVISADVSNASYGMPRVTDLSGLTPKLGMQVLPERDIVAIQTVVYQMKEHGLTVEQITLPAIVQRFEVRTEGKPYNVKFSLYEDIEQQVGAYLALDKKLQKEGIIPAEYVDVRVADRVYYK